MLISKHIHNLFHSAWLFIPRVAAGKLRADNVKWTRKSAPVSSPIGRRQPDMMILAMIKHGYNRIPEIWCLSSQRGRMLTVQHSKILVASFFEGNCRAQSRLGFWGLLRDWRSTRRTCPIMSIHQSARKRYICSHHSYIFESIKRLKSEYIRSIAGSGQTSPDQLRRLQADSLIISSKAGAESNRIGVSLARNNSKSWANAQYPWECPSARREWLRRESRFTHKFRVSHNCP